MQVVIKEFAEDKVKVEVTVSREEYLELRNDLTLESREGSQAKHLANQLWMTTI